MKEQENIVFIVDETWSIDYSSWMIHFILFIQSFHDLIKGHSKHHCSWTEHCWITGRTTSDGQTMKTATIKTCVSWFFQGRWGWDRAKVLTDHLHPFFSLLHCCQNMTNPKSRKINVAFKTWWDVQLSFDKLRAKRWNQSWRRWSIKEQVYVSAIWIIIIPLGKKREDKNKVGALIMPTKWPLVSSG